MSWVTVRKVILLGQRFTALVINGVDAVGMGVIVSR